MLCGRRSHNSPSSGAGQSQLKNCPALTANAFSEASRTRCLYSPLTQSLATTGHSVSSAGSSASPAPGMVSPTTNGAEAKGWDTRVLLDRDDDEPTGGVGRAGGRKSSAGGPIIT